MPKLIPCAGPALVTASIAQLGFGVAGLVVALDQGHEYHFLVLHGRPDRVARDALVMGTAFSAPATMLVAQGVAVTLLARDDDPRAGRVLGTLGAMMCVGYLGESLVRYRLRRAGWNRVESPLVVAGLSLAGAMAWLGRRPFSP